MDSDAVRTLTSPLPPVVISLDVFKLPAKASQESFVSKDITNCPSYNWTISHEYVVSALFFFFVNIQTLHQLPTLSRA